MITIGENLAHVYCYPVHDSEGGCALKLLFLHAGLKPHFYLVKIFEEEVNEFIFIKHECLSIATFFKERHA